MGVDTAGNLYVGDKGPHAVWKFTPRIDSSTLQVQPDHGGNAGAVTLHMTGSGVQNGASVTLTGLGDHIVASNVTITQGSDLTATFDLTVASSGTRNVVVTNPTQRALVLLNELRPTGVPSDSPARAYSVLVSHQSFGSPSAPASDIKVPILAEPSRDYLVRLQVDGADSPVYRDASGRYTTPAVTVP
jgi:hypothetical protein